MLGITAFLIFASTMGLLVFTMSFLGATSGPALAISLRLWGRRVQVVSGIIIIVVGTALIYSSATGGVLNRVLLTG